MKYIIYLSLLYIFFLSSCGTVHKIIGNHKESRDTTSAITVHKDITTTEKKDIVVFTPADTITNENTTWLIFGEEAGDTATHVLSDVKTGTVDIKVVKRGNKIKTTAIVKPQPVKVAVDVTTHTKIDSTAKTSGHEKIKDSSRDVKKSYWQLYMIISIVVVVLLIILSILRRKGII